MRKTTKKLLSIVAAATLLGSTAALAACSDKGYQGDPVTGYDAAALVRAGTNGGFTVEKGDYVYFINGQELYTANNSYGNVVKGSLMRISKEDLKNGNYENTITVVPSLVSSENFEAGIFIYGDYVYYASPTTDKNEKGEIENTSIDMKRARIDGKAAPDSYFFRLESNTSKFRYVVVADVDRNNDGLDDVFCMYEATNSSTGKSELRSYNTATKETSVLVAGASSIVYNTQDLSDPNVYYTMGVTYHADADNSISETYNQLFTVRADARATVNESEASYTVEGGRTYDFDKAWMKKQNKKAENDKKDKPYSFGKYQTYPYVNLGTLVLDGVGSNSDLIKNHATPDTRYNVDNVADSDNNVGYTYSISRYENGGIYFTRSPLDGGSDTTLYYLSNERDAQWNTITANKNNFKDVKAVDVVAKDTTNASSTAVFLMKKEGDVRKHTYLYLSNNTLTRADVVGGETTEISLMRNLSSVTLWKTVGNYLYYYGTGTNGNNLFRINYTGKKSVENGVVNDPYNSLLGNSEYQPVEIVGIDWNSSWYKPEFVNYDDGTSVFMYSNAQSYGNGGVAYNYVYAAKIGKTEDLKANADKYQAVKDYLGEYSSSTDATNLINYFFRTDLAVEEESKNLYDEKLFAEIESKFKAEGGELVKESQFIGLVGEMKAKDEAAIEDAWKNSLLTEKEEVKEEDESLPGWAIALIVVGSVLVVAIAVGVPAVLYYKNKKAKKAEEEATVNAYKRKKIDTTDDKSIDVYADDEEAEEAADKEAPAAEEEAESNE